MLSLSFYVMVCVEEDWGVSIHVNLNRERLFERIPPKIKGDATCNVHKGEIDGKEFRYYLRKKTIRYPELIG